MMELGIKPVYVFDGKAPELKSVELAAREEKKQQAEVELKAALESGDAEEIRKASHRSVRVTQQMNADVQELLRLLGCPVVLAPCEAEASCAALCQAGRVYATATEDMDALTFGSPVMLKNLFDTESSRTQTKRPVFEISLATALQQLDVSMDAFKASAGSRAQTAENAAHNRAAAAASLAVDACQSSWTLSALTPK